MAAAKRGPIRKSDSVVLVVSKPQGELCGHAPRREPEGNTQRDLLGRMMEENGALAVVG